MKVAYFPVQVPTLLGNQAFDADHPANRNGALDRWIVSRDLLASHGIDLQTIDRHDPRSVDAWIVEEPTLRRVAAAVRRGARPRAMLLLMVEPRIINAAAWRAVPLLSRACGGYLTWSTELASRTPNVIQYTLPLTVDRKRCEHLREAPRAKLALMMHSNKTSRRRGELYTLRRQYIRAFEARAPGQLDVFGHGWNDGGAADPFFTPTYAGTTPDKWAAYAGYRFSVAIDNSVQAGYITYDPLVSMWVGTVPIYMPMPDSDRLIPRGTYVDASRFASAEEAVQHVVDMPLSDWEELRARGWEFVTSPRFAPFETERFAESVLAGVRMVAGQGGAG